MSKVLCFGEFLLRYSPQLSGEWIRQEAMPVYIGGSELNVATALATWQTPVAYFTALPDNYLSKEIITNLKEKNIDTTRISFSGSRIGTYYLPQGTDLKHAGVIYDRAHSSFAQLKPGQLDWNSILKDISWFHFSAISPALTEHTAALCREAVQEAVKRNIFISVDLNFRSKLWQYGKSPLEVMPNLVQYCDCIMGNIWAVEEMLGIATTAPLQRSREALLEQSQKTSMALRQQFPTCKQVANTFRFDKEEGLLYYATLFRDGQLFVSPEQFTPTLVDRIGSGDCFMAGLIYASRLSWSSQETIDFAAGAAFNKLFIKGDATTSSVTEIKNSLLKYA